MLATSITLAFGPRREAFRHLGDVGLGVPQPTRRIGGEIGVVREDVLRALEFLKLHQKATSTHPCMKREECLAGSMPLLAEHRNSPAATDQVGEGVFQPVRRKLGTSCSHLSASESAHSVQFAPSLCAMGFSPRWRRYHSTVQSSAVSSGSRRSQLSRARAFDASTFRKCASCG